MGIDPRAISDGRCKEVWREPANHYLLTEEYLTRAISGEINRAEEVHHWFANPENVDIHVSVAGAGARTKGIERVKWIAPLLEDAAAAFMLVMLHTGWNLSTVASIDISKLSAWCDFRLAEDETVPKSVSLFAMKERAGREQFATSLTKPFSHPYRVIKSFVAGTEFLRALLRDELARERKIGASITTIRRLEAEIRSPWLYFRKTRTSTCGRVGVLGAMNAATAFTNYLKDDAVEFARNRGAHEAADRLAKLRASDIRDGYAAHLNKESMFNLFLVQRGLGHASIRTTRRYLRKRHDRIRNLAAMAQLQEQLLIQVAEDGSIDTTLLALKVQGRSLSETQIARLRDHRQRTRMGMGCLEPTAPPPEFASASSEVCTVHRCVLCHHGVVFTDSWRQLSRRAAELEFIRGRSAALRFSGSTFELEWIAIEGLLARIAENRRAEIETEIEQHLERLRSGSVYLFEEIPDA